MENSKINKIILADKEVVSTRKEEITFLYKEFMAIEGGATIWARKTIYSDIFTDKPDKWFKIWFYIINKVHWKDSKKYKRGQDFFRYDWIQSSTGASKDQIKHCIAWLKNARQIATQKKTRGMIITVINYDYYQDLNNYRRGKEADLKATHHATQMPYKSHAINNKGKKENKDIIDFFVSSFKEIHSVEPEIDEKDFLLVEKALGTHPPEEVKEIIKYYRDSEKCEKYKFKLSVALSKDTINNYILYAKAT